MNKLLFQRSYRSPFLNNPFRLFSGSSFKGVQLDYPYTGELTEKVPFLNQDEQKVVLKRCWESYKQFRYQPLDARKKIVSNIA